MQSSNLLKWRILFKVLPFTLLFCLAKWGTYRFDAAVFTPWNFDVMTGSLFGTTTFVIAFILSGTLVDYRASEDMVTQIAIAVESIQDTSLFTATNHPDYSTDELTQGLIQVPEAVLGWLTQNQPFETVNQTLTNLNPLLARLEAFTSGPIISRVQGEQKKIRLVVAQMRLIRETDFLAPAYVLLQLFLVGTIINLLFTTSNNEIETLIVSGCLFTSFLYLVLLIRDLDNPFQYDDKSCVDVDLAPLTATIANLQTHLGSPKFEAPLVERSIDLNQILSQSDQPLS